MMNKRGRIAIFEISNLVLAIIAFSFLVGLTSVGVVSGEINSKIVSLLKGKDL